MLQPLAKLYVWNIHLYIQECLYHTAYLCAYDTAMLGCDISFFRGVHVLSYLRIMGLAQVTPI